MTLVPLWCLFLHVIHGHIYRYDRSWNGYGFHTYPHPAKKPVVPRDIMVDVINNLGLKLLAIHNEYNENNIAISPYGALSVIVALGEGLEGDSIYEIQQATHIPNDISIIRVGLRDIHRHLKSYFIPKEGFLAGMTLNHENVTLRPEYEEILRFYGYDTATFNNALYPQPEATEKPQTTSGDITTTDLQTATEIGRTDSIDMTTDPVIGTTVRSETTTLKAVSTETTTILPETTTNVLITEENITITVAPTTESKITEITTVQTSTSSETTMTPTTTEKATTNALSTTAEGTTSNTVNTPSSNNEESTSGVDTTQPIRTTREISTTEATTGTITFSDVPTITSQISMVEPLEAGTTTEFTTIQNTPLSTDLPSTLLTTTESSTSLISETAVGRTTPSLVTIATETNADLDEVTQSTIRSGDPTLGVTLYTSPSGSTSTLTSINTDTITSLTTNMATTNSPEDSGTEKDNKDNEIDSTDSSADGVGFGGVSKRIIRSGSTRSNQSNVIKLNMREAFLDSNRDSGFRRSGRSVVDYLIARYYDDQFNFYANHRPYIPEDKPGFLIYGKYREYDINFIKYSTVLPFHYEPHLNALALSFPLDSSKYYLLLLLPADETGIDKLICDLRLNGSIKYIIANLRDTHVVATIPSFTLKGYVTLTPSFQKLGIRKVFEPRQADFAPMTNQRGIYVTNIEQAITVTIRNYVDPNTVQDHRNLHRHDPVHFKADHPFLYFVIDSDIHVTLMAGKIVNPLNSRIS